MYQHAKIHSLISLSGFIRMLVLFGLCGYTSYIVYKGPICSWTRNSTIIRKNEINTDADLQLGMFVFKVINRVFQGVITVSKNIYFRIGSTNYSTILISLQISHLQKRCQI